MDESTTVSQFGDLSIGDFPSDHIVTPNSCKIIAAGNWDLRYIFIEVALDESRDPIPSNLLS